MTMDKPRLAPDPMMPQLSAKAQNDETVALQHQLIGDSASLMARYGTRLTLASLTQPQQQAPFTSTGAANLATLGRVA